MQNLPEDDHVKLALLIREVQSLGKHVFNLNDSVAKFIELTDKKVDKQIYIEDKKHNERLHDLMDRRVKKLENEHENAQVARAAKKEQKDKILGVSKGAWFVIMQVVNLFVLLGILGTAGS